MPVCAPGARTVINSGELRNTVRAMDAAVLELLISVPEPVRPTAPQLAALKVLADQWTAEGLAPGILLAERLQGPVTEARKAELGCAAWPSELDLRAHALFADPQMGATVEELARREDFATGVKLLAWFGTLEEARPVHALVARTLHELLRQVEARTLEVVSHRDWTYQLANGWELGIFVRGYEFWRIDRMISPDGFVIHLIDYADGPLAELNEYEPPSDVESEVYGLGYTPTRRWK
jgi:hypothetical protein